MSTSSSVGSRQILVQLGLAVLVGSYGLVVLWMIAVAPDLRLRFLLAESQGKLAPLRGVTVQRDVGAQLIGPPLRAGDVIVRLAGRRTNNSAEFSAVQAALGDQEIPTGGRIPKILSPLDRGLPNLVELDGGKRWASVEFFRPDDPQIQRAMICVKTAPLGEASITLIWFALQSAIFTVGLLAVWNRPFDRTAGQFFVMCLTTIPAFMGGFHWPLMLGHLGLAVPFIICAVLLAPATLHFFLLYPRPKQPFGLSERQIHLAIYGVPIAGAMLLVGAQVALHVVAGWREGESRVLLMQSILENLRFLVVASLVVAGAYFAATLVSLIDSVTTTRNPVERQQVTWILWAGVLAAGFIGYTLMLAFFDRVEFAMGGGRIPMFFASLVFMIAYAVGIGRYKLMLLNQIVTRGMWYYITSWAVTATVAAAITLTLTLVQSRGVERSSLVTSGVAVVSVCLLIFIRDGWQRLFDRRFFREKYRLDKVMQRVNRSVGQLADAASLSQRLLAACREVLNSKHAALYLSDAAGVYRLNACEGPCERLPATFETTADVRLELEREGTLQRVPSDNPSGQPESQKLLRLLSAELVHTLEFEGTPTGLVTLGSKRNESRYTAEDVTFLTVLGQITGVAMHCGKVHDDLTRLNEDLKSKVDRIAQQQQQILMLQGELAVLGQPPSNTAEQSTVFVRDSIRGNSVALQHVMETVRKVSGTDATVLIRGESGTGKELLARTIHQNSLRHDGPMISVHCGALSPSLLESELFGHVQGAFTGAHAARAGRFEMADGGTLFLDEIGDISPEIQIKLLRVLQEREFERVGGSETIPVNVRLVTATHQNLERLIAEGKFREDLYYRLNVISLTLPSLRDRRDDIFELAIHFLNRAAQSTGKRVIHLREDAVDALMLYAWPGNIRELQNVIERAVVLADTETVTINELPAELRQAVFNDVLPATGKGQPSHQGLRRGESAVNESRRTLTEYEERLQLVESLRQCGGNKAQAARLLGMPRSTFFSKLRKYAIRVD